MNKFVRFIFLVFSLIYAPALLAQNKTNVELNSDIVFLGEFSERLPVTSYHLYSHAHTRSKVSLLVIHPRIITVCVLSHTENRTYHCGNTYCTRTITVCDQYEAMLSRYESIIVLKKKREGMKSAKDFFLTIHQDEGGSPLLFEIEGSECKKVVKGQHAIFDYHNKVHPWNKFKNWIGAWSLTKFHDDPHGETVRVMLKSNVVVVDTGGHGETLVKDLRLIRDAKTWLQLDFTVTYDGFAHTCLKTTRIIHNGSAGEKCVASGLVPERRTWIKKIDFSKAKSLSEGESE